MSRLTPLVLLTIACAAEVEPGADALPAEVVPPPLVLTATPFVLTKPVEFVISGAPPRANVYLGYSFAGQGAGMCPPSLGGGCLGILNPVTLLNTFRADANGEVRVTLNLPSRAPAAGAWLQAAIVGASPLLSNVVGGPFYQPGDDEDGDGLDNGTEIDLGTNPLVADTDGGGVDDGEEVGEGTDPAGPLDDVLYTAQTVDGSLDVDIDFGTSTAAVLACAFAGVCNCSATFVADGDRVYQDGYTVQFYGVWTIASTTCSASVPITDSIWVPASGLAYHTVTWGTSGETVETWVASADPTNITPITDPAAATAASQAPLYDLGAPFDGSGASFSAVTQVTTMGLTVTVMATGQIEVN